MQVPWRCRSANASLVNHYHEFDYLSTKSHKAKWIACSADESVCSRSIRYVFAKLVMFDAEGLIIYSWRLAAPALVPHKIVLRKTLKRSAYSFTEIQKH